MRSLASFLVRRLQDAGEEAPAPSGEAASPYFVFLPLAVVVLLRCIPLGNVFPFNFLFTRKFTLLHDLSIGGLLLCLLHIGVCLVVLVTTASEDAYSKDGFNVAIGMVALMNFWIALLPSSKSWVMPLLTKVPFERSIRYHQMIAPLAVTLAFIHAIMNAFLNTDIYFSAEPDGDEDIVPVYGACAFFIFVIMSIFAIEPIRRANYELFMFMHHLYPAGVILIILHVPLALWGFLPGLALHFIDAIVRLYAWAISKRARDTFGVGRITVIEIGVISSIEFHPISVAFRDKDKMYFYIQAHGTGSWSQRLRDHTTREPGALPAVAMDGPYGRLSLELERYDSVMLFAGGIGVTPFLNIMKRVLVDKKFITLKTITLHWSVRDKSVHSLLEDKLDLLLVHREGMRTEIDVINPVQLNVVIWNTGEKSTAADETGLLQNVIVVNQGRCNIGSTMDSHQKVASDGRICVLACGPELLVKEVFHQASARNIDCHLERFLY